jgi:GWxTD domain-containing protein
MRRLFFACSLILSSCAVLLAVAPAGAQVSPELAAWADGPAGFLLTDAERAELEGLRADAEVEQFIELFWARRDPDLSTRENEVRRDFEARVEAADTQLAEGDTRGALTPRGRALILLGAPDEHMGARLWTYLADLYNERPAETGASDLDTTVRLHGISFNSAKGRADIWTYSRDRLPATLDIPDRVSSVELGFIDPEGTGQFKLDPMVRKTSRALEVLDAMPATFVLHPDLDELPVFPLLEGASVASEAQLGWLDAASPVWPEGAGIQVTTGMSLTDQLPAWVAVVLPEGVGLADTVFGRLTGSDGTVEGTFDMPAEGMAVAGGTLYELEIPAPAGTYTLDIGLAAAGAPLAVTSADLETVQLEPGATFISDMVSGAEVIQLENVDHLMPFVYGGYHLVPRPSHVYDYDESLNFFCFVVNPAEPAEGAAPTVDVERRLFIGKQHSPKSPPEEVQLSKVTPSTYMYGSQLPLEVMPVGGKYRLRLIVTEKATSTERESNLLFELPEKPAQQ